MTKKNFIEGVKEAEIIERAKKIVKEGPVCDNCLGRQFAKISHGLTNKRRGEIIKGILRERGVELEGGKCWVCNDLFEKVGFFARKAMEKLRGYEFDTFLVGTKVSGMLSENEELVWEIAGASYAEPLKAELNREIGKIIAREMKKRVDFERPDVVVTINLWNEEVELQVNSVYIYGRYRKLIRGIPQTRWPCRECKGKGCRRCNFTGKMYAESVEELIRASVLEVFKGSDMILHGSGREDVDARVLGTGRPFVAEIKEPVRRKVDLVMLEEKVNEENKGKIEVKELRYVKKDAVVKIKSAKAKKTYKAKIRVSEGASEEEIRNALAKLAGMEIKQRTPLRVLHRRADLVRIRRVYEAFFISTESQANETLFWIGLRCDGGLYVKELVSGDEGRTKPSLSELLGKDAEVVELDVMEVDFQL
ncbi:MAG: tRNA pseudouridine(54/55) synthase Pus10 [Candidatus Methanospirareceae archaeon]